MSVPASLRLLFNAHGRRRLLVDANLLLLYFVGCVERRLIRSHGRLSDYTDDDFQLLAQIIHHFQKRGKIVTTPHILAEVSNLSEKLKGANRENFFRVAASQIEVLEEICEPARALSKLEVFPIHGLTDAAVASLAGKQKLLVLTADRPLAGDLQKRKLAVIHFSDLRPYCLAD